MKPVIRLAEPDDVEIVEEIVQAAYAPYVLINGKQPGPLLDDYHELIRRQLVHVIEHLQTIKGVLVLMPQDDALLLDNIAVAPSARSLGFGRALLEFAEQTARDNGCDRIRLYTQEIMVENIDLYQRIGYVETHRATEKGLNRIYMQKLLVD